MREIRKHFEVNEKEEIRYQNLNLWNAAKAHRKKCISVNFCIKKKITSQS